MAEDRFSEVTLSQVLRRHPFSEAAWVELRSREGWLVARVKGEAAAEVAIPTRLEGLPPLTLPRQVLARVLDSIPGTPEFSYSGEGLVVRWKGYEATVLAAAEEEEGGYEALEAEGKVLAEVDVEELLSALRPAAALARGEAAKGVLLELHEGKVRAAGTDGFRLHLSEARARVREPGRHLLLDGARAAWALALLRGIDEVALLEEVPGVRALRLLGRRARVLAPLSGERFPDYRAVLPREDQVPVGRMELDPSALISSLRPALVVADPEVHRIDLEGEGRTLVVKGMERHGGERSRDELEDRIEGRVAVSVNGMYLLEALEAVPGSAVIEVHESPKPILAVRGEGFLGVVALLRT